MNQLFDSDLSWLSQQGGGGVCNSPRSVCECFISGTYYLSDQIWGNGSDGRKNPGGRKKMSVSLMMKPRR